MRGFISHPWVKTRDNYNASVPYYVPEYPIALQAASMAFKVLVSATTPLSDTDAHLPINTHFQWTNDGYCIINLRVS